ncbi:MAG: gluconate kinase [Spirochaetes bacterium RBG_16_49_21]|nr:MAG: gluconate kinase [Spirochaetes bacterium RBG_16_49_21]
MVFVLMGVSGSGKSAIGRMLASEIALPFYEGDDLHPKANIAKMAQSIPLTDDDRKAWLITLAGLISQANRKKGAVLACSALKKNYREILSRYGQEEVSFIYLKGSRRIIRRRIEERRAHFMPPGLLDSQFDILEEPEDAITVEIDAPPERICSEIIDGLIGRGLLS